MYGKDRPISEIRQNTFLDVTSPYTRCTRSPRRVDDRTTRTIQGGTNRVCKSASEGVTNGRALVIR